MSFAQQLLAFVGSAPAGQDLSGSMFCFVDMNASGQLVLPSAGGGVVGVNMDNQSTVGQASPYQFIGIAPVKLGGTVAIGDYVRVDASGRAVTATGTEIQQGKAVGRCVAGGAINTIGAVLLVNAGAGSVAVGGVDDIVLGTTAPSGTTEFTFVQTTGTKTGVQPNGIFVGQRKWFMQSVAATSPIGTITGAFKTLAGAAATTLALGTVVANLGGFVWDGAAWRLFTTLGGTGSSLT